MKRFVPALLCVTAAALLLPSPSARAQEGNDVTSICAARRVLLDRYQHASSREERTAILDELATLRVKSPSPSDAPAEVTDTSSEVVVANTPTRSTEDALGLGSALGLGARLLDSDTEDPADELDLPIVTAREEIVNRFRERFFHPDGSARDEFLDNFDPNGPKTWAEVGPIVETEARSFGTGNDEEFRDGNSTTFTGRIFGLYTEATIQDDGTVVDVYFEID